MRRRDFIKVITGSAAVWPLAARAQQREQKRRVAVLMGGLLSGDFGAQAEAAALEAGLTELGWKLGSNIELEYRWPGAELDQVSIAANEIVAMRPDLVVSRSTPTTAIMMNRGLPIVFVLVTDPLFSGFVQSLGRPGGSVTGFSVFESSVGGKWLALLKEAAPAVSRVSLLFNPETAPFAEGYRRSAEAAAPTLGITVVSAPCGNAAHIESAFDARAREGSGGIIWHSRYVHKRAPRSHHRTCSLAPLTCRLRHSGFCPARRAIGLLSRLCGNLSPGGQLCRSNLTWRASWRAAGAGAGQVYSIS